MNAATGPHASQPPRRSRVLLVAFHYPPEIGGGIPRMLTLEDFLVRSGCQVVVLTPQPIEQGCRGGAILRVPLPSYLAPPPTASNGQATPGGSSGPGRPSPKRHWISTAVREWIKRWIFLPDLFGPWAIRAARLAAEEHLRGPFDLVVTSSPQESTHWIGRSLQKRFGCRWLADFRDGWTFEPHRVEASLPIRHRVEVMMERSVLRRADWVTAATRPIAEDFRARFPLRADRIHFLPTGFDAAPVAPQAQDDGLFRLVYTGRFSLSQKARTPDTFLAGLSQVLEADSEMARRFRLVLVGGFTDRERGLWRDPPLADRVEDLGQRPYEQAMRIAAGATMLLLLTPHGLRSIATRKVFDYLAVRRPVFAAAEGNEAARIVEETHAGMCVPPDDVEGIAQGLTRAFSLWQAGCLEGEFPCAGNDLYRSETHFARVLGNVVLAALPWGGAESHAR